jgi:hypothetical protein
MKPPVCIVEVDESISLNLFMLKMIWRKECAGVCGGVMTRFGYYRGRPGFFSSTYTFQVRGGVNSPDLKCQ